MDSVHENPSGEKRPLDMKHEQDLEAGTPPAYPAKGEMLVSDSANGSTNGSEEHIRARELQQQVGVLHKLRQGENWLDEKMGIETQGVDIIHEENKRPPSILNVFLLWFSMTCHVGTIPIGMLGPEFGLSFNMACAGTVIGTLLGALCTAYCGTLGPKV